MAMDASVARQMWRIGEPIHAIVYFAQPSRDAWAAAGIRGFWRGYFATRAAPLGAVGPAVVTATFYNFHPAMVARAVPDVWSMASPAAALEARLAGAHDSLLAVLGEDAHRADLPTAVHVVRSALDGLDVAGRALFAANVALPWPEDPLLALWHGLTLLREHRGDGHNAALLSAGIGGCAAHVLAAAVGGAPRDVIQPARGWSDEEWATTTAALHERGLVDGGGVATAAGRQLHDEVEQRTDELALAPWTAAGEEGIDAIAPTLTRLTHAIVAAGVLRFPNPMGLPDR
jgi:hypothetical protein